MRSLKTHQLSPSSFKIVYSSQKNNRSQDMIAADGECAILLSEILVQYEQPFGPGLFQLCLTCCFFVLVFNDALLQDFPANPQSPARRIYYAEAG